MCYDRTETAIVPDLKAVPYRQRVMVHPDETKHKTTETIRLRNGGGSIVPGATAVAGKVWAEDLL